jgi:hypothetical protein
MNDILFLSKYMLHIELYHVNIHTRNKEIIQKISKTVEISILWLSEVEFKLLTDPSKE